jgi:hypothetical protein
LNITRPQHITTGKFLKGISDNETDGNGIFIVPTSSSCGLVKTVMGMWVSEDEENLLAC